MAQDTETRRTDWIEFRHHGAVAYRIWKQRDGHKWYQRHEWRTENGIIELGDWISSTEGWSPGMEPVPDTTNSPF